MSRTSDVTGADVTTMSGKRAVLIVVLAAVALSVVFFVLPRLLGR